MSLNNSIGFIVDPQFQYSSPSSRIDNYFESLINKFKQCLVNKYTFILGDLTEFPVLDIQGIMALVNILSEYKSKGGQTLAILGNHDLYNWNITTYYKGCMQLFVKMGLITLIDPTGEISVAKKSIVVDDIWPIKCVDLRDPRNTIPTAKDERSILVGHCYYEFNKDPKHSLYYDDLRDTKFRYIFLGHDHAPYKPKLIESGATIYRGGSLGRGKADAYNFTREMGYYRLNLDTEKVEWVSIDYLPANEVFSYEVVEKHNDTTPKYVYDLDELMKSFKNKSKVKVSIRKMMEDNPEIPDEIVDFIDEVHQLCDLPFV